MKRKVKRPTKMIVAGMTFVSFTTDGDQFVDELRKASKAPRKPCKPCKPCKR